MAISDNIQEIVDQITAELQDPTSTKPVGTKVQQLAQAAILGTSFDRHAYMSIFKKTDAELARLLPTDGTIDAKRQKARAYLIANGMCGTGTGIHLKDNVTVDLD